MGRERLKKEIRSELERERRRSLNGLATASNVDSLRHQLSMAYKRERAEQNRERWKR